MGNAGRSASISEIIRSQDNWVVRLYSRVRFAILRQPFLEEIGQYLPKQGRILDLGCGFGLFSHYFAAGSAERELTGVDVDARRVRWARNAAAKLGLANVQYEVNDAADWEGKSGFHAIYMLDLIHHLPVAEVPDFLQKVKNLLVPGGTLVIKDVADSPSYKRLFTLLLDRLMVGMEPIHYWPPAELSCLLEELGFAVHRHQMKDFLPYPHVLYICRLPRGNDG